MQSKQNVEESEHRSFLWEAWIPVPTLAGWRLRCSFLQITSTGATNAINKAHVLVFANTIPQVSSASKRRSLHGMISTHFKVRSFNYYVPTISLIHIIPCYINASCAGAFSKLQMWIQNISVSESISEKSWRNVKQSLPTGGSENKIDIYIYVTDHARYSMLWKSLMRLAYKKNKNIVSVSKC